FGTTPLAARCQQSLGPLDLDRSPPIPSPIPEFGTTPLAARCHTS
ncbi:hypothetical protein RRG08_006415, partial [Elysia crispata]